MVTGPLTSVVWSWDDEHTATAVTVSVTPPGSEVKVTVQVFGDVWVWVATKPPFTAVGPEMVSSSKLPPVTT
jgi:hypothetical protein